MNKGPKISQLNTFHFFKYSVQKKSGNGFINLVQLEVEKFAMAIFL